MSQVTRLLRQLGPPRPPLSPYLPPTLEPRSQPMDSRAVLEIEQDRKRTHLAEELLKIAAEAYPPDPGETRTNTLTEIANAALAAAEVIYPEVPEAQSEGEGDSKLAEAQRAALTAPGSTQQGFQSVAGQEG